MQTLINWILATLIILVVAYIVPGVAVASFTAALLAAAVIGIINAFIRPVLFLLTLPINILTLGLFTLILNALLLMLAAAVVPGFAISSFWWALLFGVLLWLVNTVINNLFKKPSH